MGAQQSVGKADKVLVAHLNLLGDAYNPVEFIDQTQESWLDNYGRLTDAAHALKWEEVESCIKLLLEKKKKKAQSMESEIESENQNYIAMLEEVWKWFVDDVADTTDAVHKFQRDHCSWVEFNRAFLKRDNRVPNGRLNLITQAMKPTELSGTATQSDILKQKVTDPEAALGLHMRWLEEMDINETYVKEPELLVWDIACNLVATKETATYLTLCRVSHLNPENYERIATTFAATVAGADEKKFLADYRQNPKPIICALPVIVGIEELPADVRKLDTFQTVLGTLNLKIYRAEDDEEKRNGLGVVCHKNTKVDNVTGLETEEKRALYEMLFLTS